MKLTLLPKCLFFLTVAINLNNTLLAQTIDELEPVNITNNRTEEKTIRSGKNIVVIDGSVFEHMAALSLDDVLKMQGGIEVQQRGPAGSQADVLIRGTTFQQILMLIDGVRINDPITGHFAGYIPVPPADILRIEILKGPAATVYGSEAVGGVVNIITKTFSKHTNEKKQTVQLQAQAGEYNLARLSGGIHHNTSQSRWSLSGQQVQSTGQPLRSMGDKGYFYNQQLSTALNVKLAERYSIQWRGSWDRRDFAAQNFYTTFTSDTAQEKVETIWTQARISYNGKRVNSMLDLAYKNTLDRFQFNSTLTPNRNRSELWVLNYQQQLKPSASWTVVYGFMAEQRSILSNDRGNHTNRQGALFANTVYSKNRWTINGGLRLIQDQGFGFSWIPQLNFSWKAGHGMVLRGGYGQAIRAADFTERYNNYNKPYVRSGSIGNPNLQVEQSQHIELGADFRQKRIRVSTTVFFRDQQQVIDFVPTPYSQMPRKDNLDSNGTYALARNVKTVETLGWEMDASYQLASTNGWQVTVNASLLWLDSKTSDSIPSFYILSHAKWLVQPAITISRNNWSLNINSLYKERTRRTASAIGATVDRSYWLVNAQLQYKLNHTTFSAQVLNVANIQYSDILGSRMPGRWVTAGLSVNL
ncbi:MAG: TonB-dependent receptor plug domain-containing protein [Ferruginibacter sp.]